MSEERLATRQGFSSQVFSDSNWTNSSFHLRNVAQTKAADLSTRMVRG